MIIKVRVKNPVLFAESLCVYVNTNPYGMASCILNAGSPSRHLHIFPSQIHFARRGENDLKF